MVQPQAILGEAKRGEGRFDAEHVALFQTVSTQRFNSTVENELYHKLQDGCIQFWQRTVRAGSWHSAHSAASHNGLSARLRYGARPLLAQGKRGRVRAMCTTPRLIGLILRREAGSAPTRWTLLYSAAAHLWPTEPSFSPFYWCFCAAWPVMSQSENLPRHEFARRFPHA